MSELTKEQKKEGYLPVVETGDKMWLHEESGTLATFQEALDFFYQVKEKWRKEWNGGDITLHIASPETDGEVFAECMKKICSEDSRRFHIHLDLSKCAIEVIPPGKCFSGCLCSIHLPEGLKEIGDNAFQSTSFSIDFPEGLESIGEYAFLYADPRSRSRPCKIKFPKSLKSIGKEAFAHCTYHIAPLAEDDFESCIKGLEYTGNDIFLNSCIEPTFNRLFRGKLTKEQKEEGYSRVINVKGESGWSHEESGTLLTFQEAVDFSKKVVEKRREETKSKFIYADVTLHIASPETDEKTFYDLMLELKKLFNGFCGSLHLDLSKCVIEAIPDKTFFCWYSLLSIQLPEGLKKIGDRAFHGCRLVSVKISEGLESIGKEAFSDCDKLKSITLPESLKNVGDDAFKGCRKLK